MKMDFQVFFSLQRSPRLIPAQRRWYRRMSSCHWLDQSSPNTRHQIMRLHARLDLDNLPIAGPDKHLLGDPVKPTPTEHARPDEAPKPWKRQHRLARCHDWRQTKPAREWVQEGLTLNRSRHDVLIPTMLPEKELTTGFQEPIQTPGLLARVRDRALPARRALPNAIQSREEGEGEEETHHHLHANHTVHAALHDAEPRQRVAVLDTAGHERVLGVLPQGRLPQAVVEFRGKGRVGLHAVDVGDARGVEPVQLGACPGPEVQDHAVGFGDEGGDRGRGLEGDEVVP